MFLIIIILRCVSFSIYLSLCFQLSPALYPSISAHLSISIFPRLCDLAAADKSLPSHLSVGDLMDCSPPGSFVHGILQAGILEWVAISFSRGSSPPRDRTCASYVSCIGRQVLYHQCHLGSPLRPWVSYLTSLCFIFLICIKLIRACGVVVNKVITYKPLKIGP